jgi:hypothetical protein
MELHSLHLTCARCCASILEHIRQQCTPDPVELQHPTGNCYEPPQPITAQMRAGDAAVAAVQDLASWSATPSGQAPYLGCDP